MELAKQQQQQQQQSSEGKTEPAANEEPEKEEDTSDEAILAKIKTVLSGKKAGDFLKGIESSTTLSEDGELIDSKKEEDKQAGSWDRELERERREREKDRARERERRRVERERDARKRERDEREYREMEKEWDTREREKERLRERRDREEKKERERQIDLELNYDEEEDRKRRKAGKRRKEREREEQDDAEDRTREVDEEQARREEERRRQEEELRRQEEEASYGSAAQSSRAEEDAERTGGIKRSYDASFADDTENGLTPISPDSSEQRIKLGLRISAPTLKKPTKLGVTPGFNPDEEQNSLTNPKRKKLVPLEPMRTEEQLKKEREEEAKQIVAMIPASKADLFSFQLDWDIVDEAGIVPKKMKSWVTKKIVEYLGEEEATLIEFVLAKMANHMAPQEILDQLAFVLEDEAEVFVIKLWRMLIFEMIRAQKAKERGVNIAL
jgi:RNA-binding protein 25